MAMRRANRRRFRRTFGGSKNGRQFWWLRFTPFALTLQEAASATHSDILLTESDWQNPIDQLNSTQRGGARLERLIIDYGIAIIADAAFITPTGDGQITQIPEFMIWKQSDQFVSVVSSSAQFDATRESQRIIMDEIPLQQDSAALGEQFVRSTRGRYETTSKVRLADASLGVAWRGLFNTGSANLVGYSDWVRPTILMSTP